MRPAQVKPVLLVSTNNSEDNASSPPGSVGLGPSSPRGPPFQNPSSARDPVLLDPSAPKGLFPVPSSSSGSPFPRSSSSKSPLFPDPSFPRSPPFLDSSSSLRGFSGADSSTFQSFLAPESVSPRRTKSLIIEQSSRSLGQSGSFSGGILQQKPSEEKDQILNSPTPITNAKELKQDDDEVHWLCATMALLLICVLLLVMVSMMSTKVREMENLSQKQIGGMTLRILYLSETLKQLQMGKVWTCTMCRIHWVQRADFCFLFTTLTMTWRSSKEFCVSDSSTLVVMETKDEMDFLRQESAKYVFFLNGRKFYHKFWTGLQYKSSTNLTLSDGTPVYLSIVDKVPNPCIMLVNGRFYIKSCQKLYSFICKARVEFGVY